MTGYQIVDNLSFFIGVWWIMILQWLYMQRDIKSKKNMVRYGYCNVKEQEFTHI